MTTYETVFISVPNLGEEDETALVGGLVQMMTERGGVIHADDRMGRRRLAYPIKKHDDGIYRRFLYDSAPDVPVELERRLRLSDKVLRHLTVRLEPEWAEAAKEKAVRDAEARVAAEAARAAAEAVAEKERLEAEKRTAEEQEAIAEETSSETPPEVAAEAEGGAASEQKPEKPSAPPEEPEAEAPAEEKQE